MNIGRRARVLLASLFLVVAGTSCDKGGSSPTLYPEIRFEVIPAAGGEVAFAVDAIITSKTVFTFPEGTVFTGSAPFSFFLLDAGPPYQAVVRRVGDADVTVRVFQYPNETFAAQDSTGGAKDTATVSLGGLPSGPYVPAAPAVRFDLCAPYPDESSCSTTGNVGVTRGYNAVIGDLERTHLSIGATPAIYFLVGGNGQLSGVFDAVADLTLQAQLFVDNALEQTEYGSDDQIIKYDL